MSTERKYLWELHVDIPILSARAFFVCSTEFSPTEVFVQDKPQIMALKVDFAHEYNLSKTKTISWCSIKVSNKIHPILSKFWEKVKSFFFLLAVIIVLIELSNLLFLFSKLSGFSHQELKGSGFSSYSYYTVVKNYFEI